jgi:hypothetical protein
VAGISNPPFLNAEEFIIPSSYDLKTFSVVWWSEFLATDPEVPGSISGATRFSEK